jgi:hypothetical protein
VTALCGGGSSAPKLGVDIAVAYSAGRLAQLLVAGGVGELSAWLPFVGVIPVVTAAFCASDPPTMAALTSAESNAIATNTFGPDFLSGLGKFKDALLNVIWNDICHCTSGVYTPPVVPAPPADTPFYVPPTSPGVVACALGTFFSSALAPSNSFLATPTRFPGLTPTSFNCVVSSTIFSGAGQSSRFNVGQNSGGSTPALLQSNDIFLTPAQTKTVLIPAAPGVATVQLGWFANGGTGTSTVSDQVDAYCNGQVPGGSQLPCCPPDQATQTYLDAILQAVTLIQRQSVPFGYVTGAVHAGLAGAGALSIGGLLGVKVEVTTLPGHFGLAGTSPPFHFDLGFLTFGTADGFPSAYPLTRNPQIILPPLCGAFTDLDYDLAAGVVVTITELIREA